MRSDREVPTQSGKRWILLCGMLILGVLITLVGISYSGEENTGTGQDELLTNIAGYGELAISQSHTYRNMTLFILSRTAQEIEKPVDCITLDEGLTKKIVLVTEKEQAEVRTLQVENLSEQPLFIQVGDVLKGGKQDRTVQASLIIPPKSGKVDVPSLCVEQSRWQGAVMSFGKAGNSANSNDLKMAIQQGDQGQVWEEVAEYKDKAEKITGINSKTSSLNEEMDSEKMKQACAEYEKNFTDILKQYPRAIGVAYVLNGKTQTVELFQNNGLFQKTYAKILNAFATDAVVNPASGETIPVTNGTIKYFLAEMEKGETKKQAIAENEILRLENDSGFSSEVKDPEDRVMHRQYLKK
ncbi:MAG: DUF6569 family protein [Planctomycetota bacterium]